MKSSVIIVVVILLALTVGIYAATEHKQTTVSSTSPANIIELTPGDITTKYVAIVDSNQKTISVVKINMDNQAPMATAVSVESVKSYLKECSAE